MTIMYHRKTGRRYEVHSFDVDHNVALCYDANEAAKNGQGWIKIGYKHLIPEEYYNIASQSFQSKTERNKLKAKLRLVDPIWECTDGSQFDEEHLDEAIEYQKQLEEQESNERR